MPFFIVTSTSLVEADDERTAADNAVAELRHGRQVKVAVKSDELTVRHLIVEAGADAPEPVAGDQDCRVTTVLPRDIAEQVHDIQVGQVDKKTSGWRIGARLVFVGLIAFVAGTIIGLMI